MNNTDTFFNKPRQGSGFGIKWLTAAFIGLCLANSANAAMTLGNPIIVLLPNGTTEYDASASGVNFKVDTGADYIVLSNEPNKHITGGAATIRITVKPDGSLDNGDPSGDDLNVTGTLDVCNGQGTLLTGEVKSFVPIDSGSNTDIFEFGFNVTGGCLASLYGSEIGVVISSEKSGYAGHFNASFSGGAKGNLGGLPGPNGAIKLDARCLVQQPSTPGPWSCSDAKPIDELTMLWNGAQTINVKAWKGSVGSTLLSTQNGIDPGDEVIVSGYAGSPNDVYWELFDSATGAKIGESTFHLSCSDADMNGSEDCGNAEGNGKKDASSLINDWLLNGMGGNGQSFSCAPQTPTSFDNAGDQCQISAQTGVGCKMPGFDGKPVSLTFKYTAGDCASGNNPQSGKATCTGAIDPAAAITASAGQYPVSPANVPPGGIFTVSGPFGSNTGIQLSNAGGTQTLNIHTSCSQPLAVGDTFGALSLVGLTNDKGVSASSGANIDYFCKVSNPGPVPLHAVTLTEDLVSPAGLSSVCKGAVIGDLAVGASQTIGPETRFVSETTTDLLLVEGKDTGDKTVSAADDVLVQVVKPPAPACLDGMGSVEADFNGAEIPAGRTIWFNSVIKTKKLPASGASVSVKCGIKSRDGLVEFNPAKALITYDPNLNVASTVFNDAEERWETKVPVKDVNAFMTGFAYPSAGLPGGIKHIGWHCELTSNVSGLEAEWKWTAAVYTDFSPVNSALGVKPVDGDKLVDKQSIFDNSDHAGTPEYFKTKVVDGARGHGGSNYTGSYSGTVKAKPCPDGSSPPANVTFDCDGHIDTLSLVWKGLQAIDVEAYRDKNGTTLQKSLTHVASGETISVSGYSGSSNDVIFKIYQDGDLGDSSGLIGLSKFHLSCSDKEMNGAEDCGIDEGNGKKNESGFLNQWILKGLTTEKGSTLSCP